MFRKQILLLTMVKSTAYTDNKFSVQQNIQFPTVYARQKSVLNEEWKNGMLNISKENELKNKLLRRIMICCI